MRHLIVNADDLGADLGRNAGILEAVRAGVVTSVSALANGPALDDALRGMRGHDIPDVSWGLHLNLSEGWPVAEGLRVLTGPDGRFLGKAATHRRLMGAGDKALEEEIARELAAQLAVLTRAGLEIRHLDGHQHVHVLPAAIGPVMRTARALGIPWVRIPKEPPPSDQGCPVGLLEEGSRFSVLARAAYEAMGETPPRATDAFRGLFLKGRMTLPILEETLSGLNSGLTELMVHPGRPLKEGGPKGPFSAFSTVGREHELETLLHPGFRLTVARLGLILCPFPEISP